SPPSSLDPQSSVSPPPARTTTPPRTTTHPGSRRPVLHPRRVQQKARPKPHATHHPTAVHHQPITVDHHVVVVLDPGHNGGNASHPEIINRQVPAGFGQTKACNTTGTATDAGYSEHAFNWAVASLVRQLLTQHGVTVVMTRNNDTGVGPCVNVRAE